MPLPETLPMASAGTRRSGNRATRRIGPGTAESVNMSSYRSSSFGGSTSSSSGAVAVAAMIGEEKSMDPMSTFSRFWFDDDGDGGTTVQSVSIVSTLESTSANHERQPPQNDDDDEEYLTAGDATETSATVLSAIIEPREVQNRQQESKRGKILNRLSCASEMESLDVVSMKNKSTTSKSSPYKRQSPLIRLFKDKNSKFKGIGESNAGTHINESQSRRVDKKNSSFREAKVALVKRRSDQGQHVVDTEERDDSIVGLSDHGDRVLSEEKGQDRSNEIIHDEVTGDGDVGNSWFPAFWAWNFNSTSAPSTSPKKDETSETENRRRIDKKLESSKSPTLVSGGTIPSTLPKPKPKMLERPQDNSRQERQRQRIVALLDSKEEESLQQQQQQQQKKSMIATTGKNLSTAKKTLKASESTKSTIKQPEILRPMRGVPIEKHHDQSKDQRDKQHSETQKPELPHQSISFWLDGAALGGAPTNVVMATANNPNSMLSQSATSDHQDDVKTVPQSLTETNVFKHWGRSGSRGNVGKKDLRGMVNSFKAQRLMDQMMQRQNSSSEGLFVSQQDLHDGGGGASQHRRLKQSISEEKRMLSAVGDAVRRRMQDIERMEKPSEDEGSMIEQGESSIFGCCMFSS